MCVCVIKRFYTPGIWIIVFLETVKHVLGADFCICIRYVSQSVSPGATHFRDACTNSLSSFLWLTWQWQTTNNIVAEIAETISRHAFIYRNYRIFSCTTLVNIIPHCEIVFVNADPNIFAFSFYMTIWISPTFCFCKTLRVSSCKSIITANFVLCWEGQHTLFHSHTSVLCYLHEEEVANAFRSIDCDLC